MSSLNLDDFTDLIERPDGGLRNAAEERRERQDLPPGALGRLDELGTWLSSAQASVPVRPVERPKVVLFAADHGVAELDVSSREAGTAHALVRGVLDGASPVAILARRSGVPVRVVDVGLDCEPDVLPEDVVRFRVRRGSGRIDVEDALTAQEAEAAFRAGMALADEEVDSGTDLVVLGDMSVGGTTAAATLIAALCGVDASVVTGRGEVPIDDLAWMRKCAAVRDALRRARPALGDQLKLLATAGGADFAAITGFLLQCAVRKTPVILDGVVSAACALVAQRVAFRAPDWWIAGHDSGEPAQAKALDRMAIEPLLTQGVRIGQGTGALLALPLVQAAAALSADLALTPEPEPEQKPEQEQETDQEAEQETGTDGSADRGESSERDAAAGQSAAG
ncbi:nicotinate-nucleotide--dimethylbenzimidazole phosphoribosyltransferase [Streptomyces sp. NPDC127068]|uniref:nicotinate-nucleotide--dimethylbenzimidazole phosphoribosyltransferase n=1 Tax=Streptomyces sp. NPDC127068 TaxID=3347127 RepID=UPI00365C5488